MIIDYLMLKLSEHKDKVAIIWKGQQYKYSDLNDLIIEYLSLISEKGIEARTVSVIGDYSPYTISFLIAALYKKCIVLPLSNRPETAVIEFCEIAEAEHVIKFDEDSSIQHECKKISQKNIMLKKFKLLKHPGLVIFSSGSTGVNKGILHDVISLFEKFSATKKCVRVLSFLLLDHIGGLNTLFYTLFNGGTLVVPSDRSVSAVCNAIEQNNVEAIITTPTFLNMLVLNQTNNPCRLNSLRVINYGSEVMPEYLLVKLHELFPNVRLSQAYGLSETGVLPIHSISHTSTFMKIEKNENYDVRIVNGMLEIKTRSSMVGYLNSDTPIDEDGWFKTGDMVEVRDDCFRILGRNSDLINIGGAKVYPSEIENVLRQMDNVEDVLVYGKQNAITGNIVIAKVRLFNREDKNKFQVRMKEFCNNKLSNYKIPQQIILTNDLFYGERYKKMRKMGEI